MLAKKIKKAIDDRYRALDRIESSKEQFDAASRVLAFAKSNSERNLNKMQKEDLMVSEHTIVNIRAHDSENYDGDASGQDANRSSIKERSRGPSTRVEYHSDRDRMSGAA